jgi:hypothetical protein
MTDARVLVFWQLPQEIAGGIQNVSGNRMTILGYRHLPVGSREDYWRHRRRSAVGLAAVSCQAGAWGVPLDFAAILGVNPWLGNATTATAPIPHMAGCILPCAGVYRVCLIYMDFDLIPMFPAATCWPALSLFTPGVYSAWTTEGQGKDSHVADHMGLDHIPRDSDVRDLRPS